MNNEEINALVAEKVMGYSEPIEVSKARSLKSATLWRTAFKHAPHRGIGDYSWHVDRAGNTIYVGEPHNIHFPENFITDPRGDYQVLCKVRESWEKREQVLFYSSLSTAWDSRSLLDGDRLISKELYYEVGDYSRAALAALGELPKED